MASVHETAVRLLNEAARDISHIAVLPPGSEPRSVDEAHALQKAVVVASGEAVAGWKVATDAQGQAMWGAIYAKDCLGSPAAVDAGRFPMRGVEGEVAFRFERDLPARQAPYSRDELRAILSAFPAIEIVDTRFASYEDTPVLHRLADRMSNGGIVLGTASPSAASLDLTKLHVSLSRDDETVIDQMGGHSKGAPLLPVLDFIHAVQAEQSFAAGQFITAGTFTGLVRGAAGESYVVSFEGLGDVSLSFI